MKILYFDCFSGISGDMVLGSLLDLGLDQNSFKEELKKLNINGYKLEIKKTSKNGISGTDVVVHPDNLVSHDHYHHHVNQDDHIHNHSDLNINCEIHEHEHLHKEGHDHYSHEYEHEHDHHHRPFKDIKNIIESSNISPRAKEYSLKIFNKLAEAEGKVHGMPAEDVCFHEVGAVDSIVDIVGTGILLDMLGVDMIKASPVPLGGGVVRCQHGLIPVPAPAVLELLKGKPVYTNNIKSEITTPTGAAILSALCDEFCDFPSMVIHKTGYGMGKKDFDMPNCLRVCLGETEETKTTGSVKIIECNIDDMNGEVFGFLMDRLFNEGALDVWYTPVHMKKNRPAVMVSILCHKSDEHKLTNVLFKETTTLGIRSYNVYREVLNRNIVQVDTPYGAVAIKVSNGSGFHKAAPEYEDVKRLAIANNMPYKDVYEAAMLSYKNGNIKNV